MHALRRRVAAVLDDAVAADVGPHDLEIPDDIAHGDLAFPAMQAAAAADADPRDLAEDIAAVVEQLGIVDHAEVAGPGYVNVFFDRAAFLDHVVGTLPREDMGVPQRDGTVVLEYSSPNVAKPMHVGHFRNNALGDSLRRILSFVGYDVTAENYLGDWGTQYGKLIYAFKEYGSEEAFEEDPMGHMYDLYVRFHEEMEDDGELEEQGRQWAAKVEEGDAEAVELWERFRDASIAYHREDYERMDVHFDRVTGESTVVDRAQALVEEAVADGTLERDEDGSVFIDFPDADLPGTVLLKADGTTLYLTRDLYNLRKRNREGFDHNLYVVGDEQDLHFQQLFAAAHRLGFDTDGCEHISYGLLDLPEGSMSSREGRIIRLRDLLDRVVEEARDRLAASDRVSQEEGDIADAVGIGAAKYAALSVSRPKTITFDWDRVLTFEGDSGPYLQYANTRAKSIQRKADTTPAATGAVTDAEHRLLRQLARFPEAVDDAATGREPATLTTYLTDLADTFNTFYHDCPVLQADDDTTQRRLLLVDLFITVTDTGLDLLGIEPLDRM